MFKKNPATYVFLGGVFVSMGLGYTSSVVTPTKFPDRWEVLLGAAALSVISGLFWTVLGWRLDELQRIAIKKAPLWVDDEAVWDEFIRPVRVRLYAYLVLAVICGLGALVLLLATSDGPVRRPVPVGFNEMTDRVGQLSFTKSIQERPVHFGISKEASGTRSVGGEDPLLGSGRGSRTVSSMAPSGLRYSLAVGSIGFGGDRRIDRYNSDGTVEPALTLPSMNPVHLPEALAQELRKERLNQAEADFRGPLGEALEELDGPSELPVFDALIADEMNHLWFRKPGIGGDSSCWLVASPNNEYTTVGLPKSFTPYQIGRDVILGVWTSPDDEERLRTYRLSRQ